MVSIPILNTYFGFHCIAQSYETDKLVRIAVSWRVIIADAKILDVRLKELSSIPHFISARARQNSFLPCVSH